MYKKIKMNKDNIIIFTLLAMSIFAIVLNTEFAINDELWNFSNIYKMCNGFEIYKDLNVIITPLFFYLGELLFKVFGANYFVFRIYNTVIYTLFYYLIYRLFITLKVEKKISITYVVMLLIPTAMMFPQGANYNVLAFDFVILGVILYIKHQSNRTKNNILQGIILFLIFMTKQNIAAFYVIGLIIANICSIIENKKQMKLSIKKSFLDLTIMATIFITLVAVYAIYLVVNQNLYNAINFTILGISEFKNNIITTSLLGMIVIIVINILSVYLITSKKIKLKSNIKYNAKILLSFAIPMLLIAYPLCNKYHSALAMCISIITFLYLLEEMFLKELFSELNYSKILTKGLIIGILIFFTRSLINYIKTPQKFEYNHPYYGSNVTQEQVEYLNEMCNYITNTNPKIISSKANYFMNVLLKSNGIFDLPFKGNFGKGGEQELINKIEQTDSSIILIDNDTEFNLCSQDSEKARKYIQDNYKLIGEIREFLIYQK